MRRNNRTSGVRRYVTETVVARASSLSSEGARQDSWLVKIEEKGIVPASIILLALPTFSAITFLILIVHRRKHRDYTSNRKRGDLRETVATSPLKVGFESHPPHLHGEKCVWFVQRIVLVFLKILAS